MVCKIDVNWNNTIGFTVQGKITEIRVEGKAQGCPKGALGKAQVQITLTCGGIALPSVIADVSSTNDWFYTFTQMPMACQCGGNVNIRVECVEDSACVNDDADKIHDLVCLPKYEPTVPPTCPTAVGTLQYGDCNADGERYVNFSVTISGPVFVDAELRHAGSNVVLDQKAKNTPYPLAHAQFYPAGSSPAYEVIVNKPLGCPPIPLPVQMLPPCDPPMPGGNISWGGVGKPEPKRPKVPEPPKVSDYPPLEKHENACGSMVYIVGALMALAAAAVAVTLAVNLCVPGVTAISWWWAIVPTGLATASIALWYFICNIVPECDCPTSCDWTQIGVMTAFASAIIVAWLAACCPVLVWVSGGLGAAYTAALIGWITVCKPGECKAHMANLVALGSGAIPAISYIALVPLLAACGSTKVAAVAAAMLTYLTIRTAMVCKP